ncbi:methionine ABC transporter ATP-binding protein [Cohnella thermotolerans]|uniref:methionine ABC transporter ATP-binding protein n=1 Tax=Cohnella thermotolerans TaxID=329858 RepID=UPI000424BBED|nr:ATP-binding cassette domain-containing protein [Cohnella thermotolerans]
MIELRDVYKTFERKGVSHEALRGVNLKAEKGDIFGVIGFSGAGKSTLIRLINHLEKPTRGHVFVDGEPLDRYGVKQLREARKRIGMIFQHFNLLETRTVFDNVAIPLVLLKKSKKEIRERVTELLEFTGLSDKARNYPKELSGGQKQRVGIARALASNPSILLCDEATSALDPQTTRSILDLLKRINEQYGITMLVVTHEMSVIQQICNKVAVMENGEIVEQGNVLDVFGDPRHPTTQNFVRTVIHNEVPGSVLQTLNAEPESRLFKLKFVGPSASEPIIDGLIRRHDLKVNILFANMTEIQKTTLGHMIIQLDGAAPVIDRAAEYLAGQGVQIEEVKSL